MEKTSRILIVDDDEVVRNTYEALLTLENYHLIFAENGKKALQVVENTPCDLILLDVMMPEMDGFQVCRNIKNNPKRKHIPVVLITALDGKADMLYGLESGADEFLSKPVRGPELRARIRTMLRIKQMYDELLATLELREDLSNMIVHDIRSPLTTIMGLAQLLQLKNQDDEQAEFIAKILFQANRLDSMLNDMLMMAKMESEKTLLNSTVVDVTEMAAEIGEDFRDLFKVKNIRFISKLPDQPCLKTLDKNLFKRVLDNLMSNAYKFSPSRGTVLLKIECTETDSEPLLKIQVSDQGMGIAVADREKIFQKYEIVKLKQKGIPQVGLGLKFCHMVVNAHGGKIYIRDNEPEGSIFIVEI